MSGFSDWQTNRSTEGLKRLYDYNLTEANRIMTAPEYTRAIMVRDPKERLVSAFVLLKKALTNNKENANANGFGLDCCGENENCVKRLRIFQTFSELIMLCDAPDWRPQGEKMEPKYYPMLNFVGHFDNARQDAQRLLDRVGAWKSYGQSGWGPQGKSQIFELSDIRSKNITTTIYRYLDFASERQIDKFYESDYSNEILKLTRRTLFRDPKNNSV
jgi:hypothetical protein